MSSTKWIIDKNFCADNGQVCEVWHFSIYIDCCALVCLLIIEPPWNFWKILESMASAVIQANGLTIFFSQWKMPSSFTCKMRTWSAPSLTTSSPILSTNIFRWWNLEEPQLWAQFSPILSVKMNLEEPHFRVQLHQFCLKNTLCMRKYWRAPVLSTISPILSVKYPLYEEILKNPSFEHKFTNFVF